MSKDDKRKSDGSPPAVGEQLFAALTQQEIVHLLDSLFEIVSPDIRAKVLDQLQPDTRQTVRHILSPPQATDPIQATRAQPVSLAKLAQTWNQMWDEWDGIVMEAAQEEGTYMAQDAHWESPYFDNTAFTDDLEKVAAKMLLLLETAFQNGFSPDTGFAQALVEAEEEISSAMPEWIEIDEGFYLEEHLTTCLLTWEWLMAVDEEQDAFLFAQRIRQWENEFSFVTLKDNAFLDFFTQLSEADQKLIFSGLSTHKEVPVWKTHLENTYSHWHSLYMHYIEQYAPERYLDTLRPTIPQQWQNGLPLIEDLLAKEDYQESLAVIEETMVALLKPPQRDPSWTPEASLLFPIVGGLYYTNDNLESHKTLLHYYQQTAQGLGQSQRVHALDIQLRAFDHFFDWQCMFKAFEQAAVSKEIRQALFGSWRDHIVQRASQRAWGGGFGNTGDTWWLHWLIESIVDTQKGPAWFQNKLMQWLGSLPGKGATVDKDFAYLRLLTKDVTELNDSRKNRYPRFHQVVVRPRQLSTPDDASRQAYLQGYAPDDVSDRVMAYWQGHLDNWVPRPEVARHSDYTIHAQWMAALHELTPRAYEALVDRWRVEHRRRRNLWQAMKKMGLE